MTRWTRVLAMAFVTTALPAVALAAPSYRPAEMTELVKAVDIPYQQFTLDNGLRVIVSTDRKAPVVAVSVWYHVGSKDEPKGKTGFAHLFEHLMFNGSENADGEFFIPLENAGATDFNGTTWFDRTNYFQTVPKGALELALFLESDRMGHLLGAVTQAKLDNQRGVVQNEKRQGDNQPFGLVEYAQLSALFPEGHPYRHSTIGSMEDLEAASLDDVKHWFKTHYGPNNAVLVLAGDIDLATARPLVEKYFGDIAKGPTPSVIDAAVPTLAAPKSETMHDKVATTRVYRMWAVPGLSDADSVNLNIAASVLGGLASSRLDNILVKDEKLAVSVSAYNMPFEKVGIFQVQADVRPGVSPALVEQRLDQLIQWFLETGPTADEVNRVATRYAASRIAGLEKVGGFGGKAVALAEGALYTGDPEFYKKQLDLYATATPDAIKKSAAAWLNRPVYKLTVAPGDRAQDKNNYAEVSTEKPRTDKSTASKTADKNKAPNTQQSLTPSDTQNIAPSVSARATPDISTTDTLKWPEVERTTLSNGIEVIFARRATVPTVRISMAFDAGFAADDHAKLGTHSMMVATLDEGTLTRSSVAIAEEQERLGASISPAAGMDRTSVGLFALKANLAPSLALFADIIRNPAFDEKEVDRVRHQTLTRIKAEKTTPSSLALRELPPLLYGTAHPYGIPFTGSGTEAGVKAVTVDDLKRHHQQWIRPDNAVLFVTGDTSLDDLRPMLETAFGDWKATSEDRPKKLFRSDRMARPSRIILIDRPGPQSLILAGHTLGINGKDDPLELVTANEILGGSFSSRLNMDLRETKGWSYGVGTQVYTVQETMPFLLFAPVQVDRTGDSIKALLDVSKNFLQKDGVTADEFSRTINNQIRSLPGSFETSRSLLSGIANNHAYNRADDYYVTLADRYSALNKENLDAAARQFIDPDRLIWVIIGDAQKVRPQLDQLKLPVEVKQIEE